MANILTIDSVQDIPADYFDNIDPQTTLFASDIDLTAVDAQRCRIMSDSNAAERLKFLTALAGKMTPRGDAVEIAYGNEGNSYSLVEECFADFLNSLKRRGFSVMGITSRRTGLPTANATETTEDNLIRKLHALGVSFTDSSPSRNHDPVYLGDKLAAVGSEVAVAREYTTNTGPFCKNGILFASNHPKGPVLNAYFEAIASKPTMFIAIDDTLGKLHSLDACCKELGIEFRGIHYNAAKIYAEQHPVEPAIVEKQTEAILKTGVFPSDYDIRERQRFTAIMNVYFPPVQQSG